VIGIAVGAVGICAAGLADWATASQVLADARPYVVKPVPPRSFESMPPAERRRINETSRIACLAAGDALASYPPGSATTMRSVFTSCDGDGVVLNQMLGALAQQQIALSPTAFHNSVFNAPAGYWGIAARSTAPSTTICADAASFASALLEGYSQVVSSNENVLVVAVDAPFPDAVRELGKSSVSFSCALVLEPAARLMGKPSISLWSVQTERAFATPDDPIVRSFAGNAAAAALPLLRALARREPVRVSLPYISSKWLEIDFVP
jgi:Beta-ketoacyl synthase, N-terminal domain